MNSNNSINDRRLQCMRNIINSNLNFVLKS